MQIEVRDTRKKEMFRVDDEYLNGYAKLCGINATGVYVTLCRHADSATQTCFPSKELIADKLGISERSVYSAIKKLEFWGIILCEKSRKENGTFTSLIYTLVDKSCWVPKPTATDADGTKQHTPSANNDINQRHHVPSKVTHSEGSTVEGIATTSVAEKGQDQVNTILSHFQMKLNPTVNYGNKTQRKAVQELLALMGLEKLLRTIDYAAEIQLDQFAPSITTPYQLKEKLAQLTVYYQKSHQSKKGLIQTL